jgi:hypothetical protein
LAADKAPLWFAVKRGAGPGGLGKEYRLVMARKA